MLPDALAPPLLQFEKHARVRVGVIFATRWRKKPKPAVPWGASTNTGRAQEFREPQILPMGDVCKKKKPGTAGL